MNCPRCGFSNPGDDRFCGNCGAPLAPASPSVSDLLPELESQLAVLTRHDIVFERSHFPELEYMFRHALLQEASYHSLLNKQRREMHRRVAVALEQLFPLRLGELAPVLAHHFYAAEEWPQAAVYAQTAGAAAARLYALHEAAAHFLLAVDALERIPAGASSPDSRAAMPGAGSALPAGTSAQLFDALLGWVQVAYNFAPYDDLIAKLTRAEQLARELHDTPRLLQALHWIGTVNLHANFNYRAMPAMMEWFQLASDNADEKLSVIPSYWWGFQMVDRDPRGALAQFDQVIAAARKLGNPGLEAHALATKGMAHARLGEFDEARADIASALELVQGIDAPVKEADVNNLAGFAYLDMGDIELAMQHALLGSQKSLAIHATDCASAGLFCVGMAHLQGQKLSEARSAFDQTIELAEVSGAGPFKNLGKGALAIVQLMSGKPEALADLERALANAKLVDDQYGAAMFSQVLGDIAVDRGNYARAEEYLSAALAYYRRVQMKPYIVRVLQSLSRLYTRQDRCAESQAAHTESVALMA